MYTPTCIYTPPRNSVAGRVQIYTSVVVIEDGVLPLWSSAAVRVGLFATDHATPAS